MNKFIKIGQTFFTQGNSGDLTAVSDGDTLKNLKGGMLQHEVKAMGSKLRFDNDLDPNNASTNRSLGFADDPQVSAAQTTTAPSQAPPTDIKGQLQNILMETIQNFGGSQNLQEMQVKRESLLREQLLKAPFSEEGGRVLSGSQKLSLMRSRGQELEPEIQALEKEIIAKKNLPMEKLASLSSMIGLAESLGLMEGKKLEELKLKYPEISGAQSMEEALGFLGAEIKKDQSLSRILKQAQIDSANRANLATNTKGGRSLTDTSTKLLSDGKFLPGVLDSLETLISGNTELFGKVKGGQYPFTDINIGGIEADKIKDDLDRATQVVGVFMEGGKLAEGDIARYRDMLPNLTDRDSTVSIDKLEGVREMVRLKYNQYLIDFDAAGYDVSAFDAFEAESQSDTVRMSGPGGTFDVPSDKIEVFKQNGYERI